MGAPLPPWEKQWKRVGRWFVRFSEVSQPRGRIHDRESDTYQDDAYAFFVACYHLKDWLKNDPVSRAAASGVEEFVSASLVLSICGDLANGSKHLALTRSRVDPNTSMGRRHYELHLGSEETKIAARYEIKAAGKTYDAFDIAQRCFAEWEAYLAEIGLLIDA